MAKTVFGLIQEKIDAEIADKTTFLVNGSVKDYAQYREVVGAIRGLRSAKSYIEDLNKEYMENDL